mgnify:CR=1 FL=1
MSKLEKAFKLVDLNIENADLANYHIHTVYFKTGYYFDYDWQVAHSNSVDNYLTGPMFWDILKNYDDCESDILRSYCEHIKNQLDWYQIVSKIDGQYDDGCHYIKWERITQHGLLQIIYANCIIRPCHGNYYENTLIHIGIDSVLDSWEENNGQPFIDSVRVIDSKLRELILTFDWENI